MRRAANVAVLSSFYFFFLPHSLSNSKNTRLAAFVGVLVGVLIGAGAVHTAELTADMLLARTDFHYRSARYNQVTTDNSLYRDDGFTGARRLDWRNEETRTEKVTSPALHSAALEEALGKCPERNVQCLVNEINKLINQQ